MRSVGGFVCRPHAKGPMKALTELRNILRDQRLSGPSRALSEAIVVRVRQVLEQHGLGDQYPGLQLMCHWVVHTALRDSSLIYDRLTEVSLAMQRAHANEVADEGRYANFARVGATVLDLDGLRDELRQLLDAAGLSKLVVDDHAYWYEFACGLLGLICEKPIGWPDSAPPTKKPARRYFDRFQLGAEVKIPTAVRTIEVFVQDGQFKLQMLTNSRIGHIFTVASARPFSEFDSGLIATTGWAQVRVLDQGTGEEGGPADSVTLRFLGELAVDGPAGEPARRGQQ
jgi:hypothetical protein